MNVLLLGGSGTIGRYLQNLLTEDSTNHLFITSRQKRSSYDNVHYIKGNPHDIEFVKYLMNRRWDCIIDFMTYTLPDFKERLDYYLSSADQYIFLSSARVYADSNNAPLTETSSRLLDTCSDIDYMNTNEYALEKARQEDLLIASKWSNWAIIRPYITYGVEKYQLGCFEKEEWLYRVLHGRSLVFSKDLLKCMTTMTCYKDVATGIFNCIGEKNSLKNIYQIASYTSHTWEETLFIYKTALEKLLNKTVNVVLIQDSAPLIREGSKYQLIYDRYYDRVFDSSKIEINGVINYTDFEDGIKECLEIFLKNPTWGNINWKKEAIKDRLSGDKTPLCEINGIKTKVKYFLFRYLGINFF